MSLHGIVVSFWIVVGRVIGLIFIEIDGNGNFYCVRIFPIYSALLGAFIIFCFPSSHSVISNQISIISGVNSHFAIIVSSLRDYIEFIFMIAAYYFQNINRRNLRNVLNEIKEFVISYKVALNVEMICKKQKYKRILSIGIAIKSIRSFLHVIMLIIVTDLELTGHLFHLGICLIPKITMLVVEIEFLIGILILKFNIKDLNDLINAANRKLRFRSAERLTMLKIDLELCDHFEKMSAFHSKIFKIHRDFSQMYQFQFLIMLVSIFFALMIDMFYVFNVSFLEYLGMSSDRSWLLRFFAVASIFFRCLDIYYILRGSNDANYSDALNQKLLSCMQTKGRDLRLKNCVSVYPNSNQTIKVKRSSRFYFIFNSSDRRIVMSIDSRTNNHQCWESISAQQ